MSTFGRELLPNLNTGRLVQVASDGNYVVPDGGITVDWNTVAPVAGAPVILTDEVTVPVGDGYLRYGQVLARITASGKYGPYDPAAADGRQTLTRSECVIVNVTTLQTPASGIGRTTSDHPNVLEGGRCWRDRLIASAAGPVSLAAGPTFGALEAAMPLLRYTEN